MSLVSFLPDRVRRPLRFVRYGLRERLFPRPEVVVAQNTPEAFDYFWKHRRYIRSRYLCESRVGFYAHAAGVGLDLLRGDQPAGGAAWRILDVGCGPGSFLETIRGQAQGEEALALAGIDFSSVAIAQARRALPEGEFAVADIHQPNLEPASFDLVFCMETIEHVERPDHALEQIKALVKPEGYLIVTVPNGEQDSWDGHRNFWSPEAFANWLKPHGLLRTELCCDDWWQLGAMKPHGVSDQGATVKRAA